MARRTPIPPEHLELEEEPLEWQQTLTELAILKALAPELLPEINDLDRQRLLRLKGALDKIAESE